MGKLSKLANSLVGSEIVKLGNDINNKIANGANIYNYTIGDFNSDFFPIPNFLKEEILKAYESGYTNYPPGEGLLSLRESVSSFVKKHQGIDYAINEIQIGCGGRPFIYTIFRTIVDPGDKVIYAIPSWNNNHYTSMCGAVACEIDTTPENNFLPTPESIAPHLADATLLCLCTPQNPTGTVLDKDSLKKICDLVIAENKERGADQKKLYVLFDQMYSLLTFKGTEHFHPVQLNPEMKDYTITLDGISKSFAGTGVRVGWGFGPASIISKIKALMSHIGTWAPMAEQVATSIFLNNDEVVQQSLKEQKDKIEERLWKIYEKIENLNKKGLTIEAIAPLAAIYMTIKIDLKGKTFKGKTFTNQEEVTQFLIDEVGLALVPFHCFGASTETPWYRVSVGTAKLEDLDIIFNKLEEVLNTLH
ncbi:MAG TPA: pyridoxal phosphate-dependent aminotransferase [Edaphocola sp.]|nr:pyridoxal phosphate-dependent aminotransferase [Edaphocola sp.]